MFKYCDIVIKHCYKSFPTFSLSMFGSFRCSVFRCSVPFKVRSFDIQSTQKRLIYHKIFIISMFKYCDIVIKHCYMYVLFDVQSFDFRSFSMFSLSMFGPIRGSVFRHSVFRRLVPFDVQSFDVRSHSRFGLSMFGPFRHSVFRQSVFRRSVFRDSVF